MGEDPGPAAFGETHQVDGYVDLVIADEPRDIDVALGLGVDEVRTAACDPRAQSALVVGAQ